MGTAFLLTARGTVFNEFSSDKHCLLEASKAYAEGLVSAKRGRAHVSDRLEDCSRLETTEEKRKRKKG